jgi:hypothetical protein
MAPARRVAVADQVRDLIVDSFIGISPSAFVLLSAWAMLGIYIETDDMRRQDFIVLGRIMPAPYAYWVLTVASGVALAAAIVVVQGLLRAGFPWAIAGMAIALAILPITFSMLVAPLLLAWRGLRTIVRRT